MNNPARHAFYVGRAFAEVLGERVEDTVTNTLSELGTLEAKQREALQDFVNEVMTRAEQNEGQSSSTGSSPSGGSTGTSTAQRSPEEVQEMIDELRAAIASLRTELNTYKNQNGS